MAADLAQRADIATNPVLLKRVKGAVLTVAVAVAKEVAPAGKPITRRDRRLGLVRNALASPDTAAALFCAACAGVAAVRTAYNPVGSTDADKVAGITDTLIETVVTDGWDDIAGVPDSER